MKQELETYLGKQMETLIKNSVMVSEAARKEFESLETINKGLAEVIKYLSPGDLGCAFRKGVFIIDAYGRQIYKEMFPNYYEFLRKHYNY